MRCLAELDVGGRRAGLLIFVTDCLAIILLRLKNRVVFDEANCSAPCQARKMCLPKSCHNDFYLRCILLIQYRYHLSLIKSVSQQLTCDMCETYPGNMLMMLWRHCPFTRYATFRVAHAPGMPGTFSLPPLVSDPYMHHDTCVTHVLWCMMGSLTSSFLWSRWRGKRPQHSQCMHNPKFYVSGKRLKGEENHFLQRAQTHLELVNRNRKDYIRVPGHLLFSYYFIFSPLFHTTSYFSFFLPKPPINSSFLGMQKKCTSKNMHLPHKMCIMIIACAYK